MSELSKIPVLPLIIPQLLNAPGEYDAADQLAEVIDGYPTLWAGLKELAPAFGLSQPPQTPRQLVQQLGATKVRKLAVTLAARLYMARAPRSQELRGSWRHMLATALLTEELAWACNFSEDLAYQAGLFHDLGRMGLWVAQPQEYEALLHEAGANALDVLSLEQAQFGFDHCEAGRHMAELAGLHQDLVIAAGRHHDQLGDRAVDLLHLTSLGCQLADTLGFHAVKPSRPSSVEEIKAQLPEAGRRRFCPDTGQLKSALDNELALYELPGPKAASPAPTPFKSRSVAFARPASVPEMPQSPAVQPFLSNTTIALLCAVAAAIATMFAMTR